MTNAYKLSDKTIGQIVKLIQLGILTGTDISYQMRTIRLVTNNDDGTIDPDPEYIEMFEENLQRMQSLENEK